MDLNLSKLSAVEVQAPGLRAILAQVMQVVKQAGSSKHNAARLKYFASFAVDLLVQMAVDLRGHWDDIPDRVTRKIAQMERILQDVLHAFIKDNTVPSFLAASLFASNSPPFESSLQHAKQRLDEMADAIRAIIHTPIEHRRSGIRILSLCGDGVRVLSQLLILKEIMEQVGRLENVKHAPLPCKYFDLIVGTGTGAIAAIFLGRLEMTVPEAISSVTSCIIPAKLAKHMRGVVHEQIGNPLAPMGDPSCCKTLVFAIRRTTADAPPEPFRSYLSAKASPSPFSIVDVATAACAPPNFPVSLGSPPVSYANAAPFLYNNPTELALNEATDLWELSEIQLVLCIGTGERAVVDAIGGPKRQAAVHEKLAAGSGDTVHQWISNRYQQNFQYHRLQVNRGLEHLAASDWTVDDTITETITSVTQGYLRLAETKQVTLASAETLYNGKISEISISKDSEDRSLQLLETIKDEALAAKISDWLKAPDSSQNYNSARKEHQGTTGSWFLDGETFLEWTESGQYLCIYGKAGCGKTILCSSIITHVANICKDKESSAFAYFFFDGRDAQSTLQRHDGLIRSLIQQFVDQCDGIPSTLAQLYGKGHQQPPTDALEDVLQHIVRGFQYAYVVIDSLDECTERRELIAWINRVTSSPGGQFHLLSTSRPENDIVDNFRLPHIATISMEEGSVEDDIEAYIQSKIQTDFKKWDKRNRDLIKNTLVQGAHGMFRWVSLQLEELHGCSSARALEQQLGSLPDGLDETYERILLRINKHRNDDAKRFLTWIAFSRETVAIKQLAEVVVVDFDAPNHPTYDPTRKYRNQGDILLACSGLVTNSHGLVKLAHFSVKEYLVSDRIANGAAKYFSINEKLSHRFIAETSLVYLSQFDSRESLKDDTFDVFPLAKYAASNWVFHMREGGGDGADTVQKLIMALLGSKRLLKNWIRLWDPEDLWGSWQESPASEYVVDIAEPLYYASLLGFVRVSQQLLDDGATVNARANRYTKRGNALHAACYEGHGEIVKLLIKRGVHVNRQEGKYGYALHTACHRGHSSIVRMLLEAGADVNRKGRKYSTALTAAAHGGNEDIVRLLLEMGAEVNSPGEKYGTALHAAALCGHTDVVKLLLERGADINIQGGKYGTALQAAACHGDKYLIELLLERGADVNVQGGEFGSTLQAAVCQRNRDLVELLLERRADVNLHGVEFGGALQAAAYIRDKDLVQLLLERGSDINGHGGKYGTALEAASYNGDKDLVELLLERGADVNGHAGKFGTALQAAVCQRDKDLVELLLERGADVNLRGVEFGSALQSAAYSGDKGLVELLLERGADVNVQVGKYGSALQAAASKGDKDLVELLLERGADVNVHGAEFGSALQYAAYSGDEDLVELLLERGADINVQGGEFGSALQAAACKKNKGLVELLLERGADVNIQGGTFGSTLQAAAFSWRTDVVQLLLDRGANIDNPGGLFGTPLQTAIVGRNGESVRLLLENNADVNIHGGLFGSPLQAAVMTEDEKTVQRLLAKGVDVNAQGGIGGNALLFASALGTEEIVKLLLEHHADVNARVKDHTSLHFSQQKFVTMMKLFREKEADIDAEGEYGHALQAASHRGHIGVVAVLLGNGADVNARGGNHSNALQAALDGGHEDIAELLSQNGATPSPDLPGE